MQKATALAGVNRVDVRFGIGEMPFRIITHKEVRSKI